MNRNKFSEKWNEFKGHIKQKWSKMTDQDIAQINGKWDQMIHMLQEKYDYTKEQAEKELNQWCIQCEQHRGEKRRKAG